MKIPMPDEKIAYEAIKNLKDKFGVFHKTCFHIHTPESYDFKLKSDWSSSDYKKIENCCRYIAKNEKI